MRAFALYLLLFASCSERAPQPVEQPEPLKSAYEFLTSETQALQDDDFANPGHLWVDRGAALFAAAVTDAPACASCHGEGGEALIGASARYPQIDSESGRLFNIEARINACRTRHQDIAPLSYESDDLLALTTYVGSLSRGVPIEIEASGPAAKHVARGRGYFFQRRGQFDLSCHQCHDENWGRRLRGDTISQGHGNGFPAYRLEWQSLGSLHRRFADCDAGVRAEPHELGSETYTDLELYLAVRASGIPVETPAVRR